MAEWGSKRIEYSERYVNISTARGGLRSASTTQPSMIKHAARTASLNHFRLTALLTYVPSKTAGLSGLSARLNRAFSQMLKFFLRKQ